jgi:hypothetical protein
MRKISSRHIKKATVPELDSSSLEHLQSVIEDSDDHGLSFCKFIINDLQKQHPKFSLEIFEDRVFYTLFLGKVVRPQDFNGEPKGTLMIYFAVYGLDNSWGIDYMPDLPNFIFEYRGIKYKLGQKERWYYPAEPI